MAPEEKEKIKTAFRAMRSLGIDADTVRPILKKLLKLYDGDWKLIEEDNYRTLADAIFEAAEDQLKAEVEPPSKKPHREVSEDQVSSTWSNGKTIIDTDVKEKAGNSNGTRVAESCQSISENPMIEPDRYSRDVSLKNNGKEPIGVSSAAPEEISSTGLYENVSGLRKRVITLDEGNRYAILPRPKPIAESPQLTMLASNNFPGLTTTSKYSENRKKDNGSPSDHNHQTVFQTTHDIAASSCSQVKLSLTCNHTVGQRNFVHPNAAEVLIYVDRKFMKFFRAVGDYFSIYKLLNEVCETYLEMAAEPANSSTNKDPGNCIPRALVSALDLCRKDHPEGDTDKRASSISESSSIPRGPSIVKKKPIIHDSKKRAVHKVCDITNGTEKVKISLLEDIGNEDMPHYIYTPENIVYQSAYVHVSLARIADDDCCPGCIGDCLSSSIPCACARNTGGEFAYTPDGLLQDRFLESCISMKRAPQRCHLFYCQDCPLERAKNVYKPEKCKGHLLRKFIKECWRKCGCTMQCGNRVVQRGISRKLEVFLTSEGKGWGLRTLEELPKGAFVCEYAGEILTNIELYERNKKINGKDKHVYPVLLDADWGTEEVLKDEDALCLDATYYGNVARFINHRCFDGNLIEVPVQVETPDRHYYHLAFFTNRKVEALEELTWDYGIDFDDLNHPIEAFLCSCGSRYCRDMRKRS